MDVHVSCTLPLVLHIPMGCTADLIACQKCPLCCLGLQQLVQQPARQSFVSQLEKATHATDVFQTNAVHFT